MKTNLLEIFELQNETIRKYVSDHSEVYDFISKCFDLLVNIQISDLDQQTIPEKHRKIFNYYHADIVSTLINATRMALQGCETDAYALLRVANQELGELNSIVVLSLYEEVYLEIQRNSLHGKPFSKRLQKKIDQIKDKNRNYVYGKLSNLGSHSSPVRLALSVRRGESRQKIKVGMMTNNPNVEASLLHISDHFLYAIRVFDDFFIKNLPSDIKPPLSNGRNIVESEYGKL